MFKPHLRGTTFPKVSQALSGASHFCRNGPKIGLFAGRGDYVCGSLQLSVSAEVFVTDNRELVPIEQAMEALNRVAGAFHVVLRSKLTQK